MVNESILTKFENFKIGITPNLGVAAKTKTQNHYC